MIEVVNRQRRVKIDTNSWADFAAKALDAIGKSGSSATIAFVSDKSIRKLNQQFRHIDKATDVLSFPADEARDRSSVTSRSQWKQQHGRQRRTACRLTMKLRS